MRKCRGKTRGGLWVYGYYFTHAGRAFIIPITDEWHTPASKANSFVEVIPETVGQYTSLKDKNDVEIYEGDIIQRYFHYGNDIGDSVGEPQKNISVVKWSENPGSQIVGFSFYPCDDMSNLEIIGNATDNPELLK